jgi:hypothetical protein
MNKRHEEYLGRELDWYSGESDESEGGSEFSAYVFHFGGCASGARRVSVSLLLPFCDES